MTEQDIIDAAEYADIRWSGADVPIGWLEHFVDAISKRLAQHDSVQAKPEPEQEPQKNETLHPAMDMPHDQKIAFAYGLGNGER